jgi:hypothetical protein
MSTGLLNFVVEIFETPKLGTLMFTVFLLWLMLQEGRGIWEWELQCALCVENKEMCSLKDVCCVYCTRLALSFSCDWKLSHSKVAPENVGLHLHVISLWNAVVTRGAGNALLYVKCILYLLQLCRRTWAQLFAAVIKHRTRKMLLRNLLALTLSVVRRDARCLLAFTS